MKKSWGKYPGVAAALAAVALVVAGIATAAPWEKVRAGNLEVQYNGGFSPKVLSKKKPTPISFEVAAKIASLDPVEKHPPAVREVLIEGDKHASIDVKGLPTCTAGKLQSRDSKAARKVCGSALIGAGKTDVEVKFPEQKAIPVHSELLAFSGGVKGGVTTIFIHAFLNAPVVAAVVTTVKVKKIHKGRYGLLSTATIPRIAGGSGSPTFFTLTLKKGIVKATCPDGHLNAHGTAKFEDGSSLSGTVVRPCTGKG
ncbi:MAG TPA: hypothetical protein VFN92_11625 [Solirubrobacterales bacterium]|nr:hypothetical protein [Solirubrobacterales bacterium]